MCASGINRCPGFILTGMTMQAGIVNSQISVSQSTVDIKHLSICIGIDTHQMGADIAGEFGQITSG